MSTPQSVSEITPDVVVENHGSLFLFHLGTDEARSWVEDNVHTEDWQWVGPNAFSVDHRYAQDLASGMIENGLVVR